MWSYLEPLDYKVPLYICKMPFSTHGEFQSGHHSTEMWITHPSPAMSVPGLECAKATTGNLRQLWPLLLPCKEHSSVTKIELKISSESHHLSVSNCGSTGPIHIYTTFLNFWDTLVQNSSSGSGRAHSASFDIWYFKIPFIKPNRVSFPFPSTPLSPRKKSDSRLIILKKELY